MESSAMVYSDNFLNDVNMIENIIIFVAQIYYINFCMLYIQNNSIPNSWHHEVRQWFFHISIFRHRITFVWKKSIFLNNVQFMNGAKQMSKNYWQFKKFKKYLRNAHRIFTKAEMTHSRTQTVLPTLLTHNPIKKWRRGQHAGRCHK